MKRKRTGEPDGRTRCVGGLEMDDGVRVKDFTGVGPVWDERRGCKTGIYKQELFHTTNGGTGTGPTTMSMEGMSSSEGPGVEHVTSMVVEVFGRRGRSRVPRKGGGCLVWRSFGRCR